MKFSKKQLGFINDKGRVVLSDNCAGSGKSAVLFGYATSHTDERILYLVFGNQNAIEAKRKLSELNLSHVRAMTCHSLALEYLDSGLKKSKKIRNKLYLREVKEFLQCTWPEAQKIHSSFHSFCCSSLMSIDEMKELNADEQIKLKQLWAECLNPLSTISFTHDFYLKVYQLSVPDLSIHYDTILLDEYQDTNPVIADIIVRQKNCKIRCVGDRHQQLYRFRKAVNISDMLTDESTSTHQMYKSYRFGNEIADVASNILWHKDPEIKIFGNRDRKSKIVTEFERGDKITILTRTISGAINAALDEATKKSISAIHLIGGEDKYYIQELLDVFWLKNDEKDLVWNRKLLADHINFDGYCLAATQSENFEMLRAIRIVKDHPRLPDEISLLRDKIVSTIDQADITIGTVHKSKGLEFPCVRLYDDFLYLEQPKYRVNELNDEINVLYVAATRATEKLQLNEQYDYLLDIKNRGINVFQHKKLQSIMVQNSILDADEVILENSSKHEAGNTNILGRVKKIILGF
ncbi:TPA: ATP-dependent helicase [Aeromonas veronii]|nr:ATP-dependent helicase [Aeromonas veronii]